MNFCEKCDIGVEVMVSNNDNVKLCVVKMVRLVLVGCDEVGIYILKN